MAGLQAVISSEVVRAGIFADDLTGALDAAVPFAALGKRAFASLRLNAPGDDYDVLSVNMDSRRRSRSEAAERARRAVDLLTGWGATRLFNKIDSTMRGHPGLEALAAVLHGAASRVLLAPSFPGNDRTVSSGVLSVDGTHVALTDVGRDALTPVASSDIGDIVHAITGSRPARASLETVRGPRSALAGMAGEAEITVADAVTDSDLDRIAAASLGDPRCLLSGSAGLAAALARALRSGSNRRFTPDPVRPPYLVIVGSQRNVAVEAVHALGASGRAAVTSVDAGLITDSSAPALALDAAGHMADGRSVLIHLRVGETMAGVDTADIGPLRDRLVTFLGRVASATVAQHRPRALIVVGGDTALAVLEALEVAGIVLGSEPIPGAAAGLIKGGSCPGIPVITKAGAFGGPGSLAQLCDWLSRSRRNS